MGGGLVGWMCVQISIEQSLFLPLLVVVGFHTQTLFVNLMRCACACACACVVQCGCHRRTEKITQTRNGNTTHKSPVQRARSHRCRGTTRQCRAGPQVSHCLLPCVPPALCVARHRRTHVLCRGKRARDKVDRQMDRQNETHRGRQREPWEGFARERW